MVKRARGIMKIVRKVTGRLSSQKFVTAGDRACWHMKIWFTLTGTNHYHGDDFLEKGMKIRLEKKPDNSHDHDRRTRLRR